MKEKKLKCQQKKWKEKLKEILKRLRNSYN